MLGQAQRPNTITHVCWYRNQSLSLSDYLCMIQVKMPLTFCAGGEEPWDAQENVLLPNCSREDPCPQRQICTIALLRQDFLLFMPQKNGSLCKSAMCPVFFSNYKIPVLPFHAIGFPVLLADSKQWCSPPCSPFHASFALCSCHVLFILCFLSCFISLLTQCVPCGVSAC